MKLSFLVEQYGPESRARMHQRISREYRSSRELWVMQRVKDHLLTGSSILREPLTSGQIQMINLVEAIKSKRCIPGPNQDIGYTYIKNVVGNAISDEFPIVFKTGRITVNDARRVFGLPNLRKKKK